MVYLVSAASEKAHRELNPRHGTECRQLSGNISSHRLYLYNVCP